MAKLKKLKKFMAMGSGAFFVLFMLAIFLTPAVPLTCGKALGHYPVLMEALSQCPESEKALGSGIRAGTFGLNTGSCSGGSGNWRASGRMPVSGSKGKGTLTYAMRKSGGTWTIHALSLAVGGNDVNVFHCLKKRSQ